MVSLGYTYWRVQTMFHNASEAVDLDLKKKNQLQRTLPTANQRESVFSEWGSKWGRKQESRQNISQ